MPPGGAPSVVEDPVVVRRRRRPVARPAPLVWMGVAGALVLVLSYLVGVRMGLGQGVDDWLFEGRKSLRLGFRRRTADGPFSLMAPAVLVAGLAAVVVAVRRRGAVAGVAVFGALVATFASSSVLKVVLPRPLLHDTIWASDDNSFPSGHMAGVLAVALSWVMVSTGVSRRVVTVVGAGAAAVTAVVVTGSGWHRPSDMAGAVGLAVAWSCAAALVVARRPDGRVPERPVPGGTVLGPVWLWAGTTAVLAAGAAATLVAMRRLPDFPVRSFAGYSLAVLTLVAAASTTVFAFAWACDRADPPPPVDVL